ncbi:DUF3138 family protein [Piscinibacter sakaiensis]|uniref:Porin n=1 Tax=Piscinibacter sakaiensis TaxID=1547922 RepID=A0A0K8NWN2_PISS1|nr:DUF3138 family protein [Piscinibacter sakaiensis]GAP34684.1 hypothetical protein ISF6_5392 [Piscinibacter sakaiensis]
MKHVFRLSTLGVALAAAWPLGAAAQSNEALLKELQALKARVEQLEGKLKDAEAKLPPAGAQWGMTPEQAAELNRVVVKSEALEDARDSAGFKGLKISGWADPTYIWNRNTRTSGFQFLNAVSDGGYAYDNSYFGSATIDFQKEMENGTRWRLTLSPQRGVGAVVDGKSIVQEASVSVPLGEPTTRLIAGQIPDWSGYEYQQPMLNKLVTHNLLYDFTLPTAYTGVGFELTSGKWLGKVVVANMNATKRNPREKTPVIAYRVDYSRGEYQGFGFAGVHGKAANFRGDDVNPITGDPYNTRDTVVNLFEVDAYFIRGDLTLQGQVGVGMQKQAAITADPVTGALRDSRWAGVSVLGAYRFTPRLEGIVRADYISNKKNGGGLLGYGFADPVNGIGPDPAGDPEVGANRTALSLGLGYVLDENTSIKAEYRLDRASQPVFLDVKSGVLRKSNQVFGASVVVHF